MAHNFFLSSVLLILGAQSFVNAALVCTDVAEPPAGAVCNVPGRVRNVGVNNKASAEFPAFSLDECRDISLTRTYARSFSYNSQNLRCRTYLPRVDQLDFEPDPSSDIVVTDASCSSCTRVCPDPADTDVVVNGGFERSNFLAGPWKLRLANAQSVVESPGSDSSKALVIRSPNGLAFQVLRGLCPGTYFSMTFDYAVNTTSGPEFARVAAGVNDAVAITIPTGRVGYTTVRDYFKISPLFLPVLYSRIYGSRGARRSFSFDNMAIVPFNGPLTPARGAPERVANGGFDTGRLAPWVAAAPRSGRLVSDGDGGFLLRLLSGDFYTLSQNITLVEGTDYLITFDYTAYNATQGEDSWSVWANVDGRAPALGPFTQYIEDITTQGPGQYALPFVAKQNATTLSFNIQRSCNGFICPRGFIFDIDNISVKRLAV